MKLGDNMTTSVDACDVWSTDHACLRKSRPPRIGDIPRHEAVDQESPGSGSTIPTTGSSSATKIFRTDFSAAKYLPASNDQNSASDEDATECLNASLEEDLSKLREHLESHSCTSSANISKTNFGKSKVTTTATIDEGSFDASFDDDQRLVEVRKDSALFDLEPLGETFSPIFRDQLTNLRSRVSKRLRPRRESSGYASTVGTFDEDRRNSDFFQESSLPLTRRKSSVKKINLKLPERYSEEEGGRNLDQVAERMPVNDWRKSNADVEMPDIEEPRDSFHENLLSIGERLNVDEKNVRKQFSDDFISSEESGFMNLPGSLLMEENVDVRRNFLPGKKDLPTLRFDEKVDDVLETGGDVALNFPEIAFRPETKQPGQETNSLLRNMETLNLGKDAGGESRSRKRITHQMSSPNFSRGGYNRPEVAAQPVESSNPMEKSKRLLPKSIKVYQLLATQSEDRGDGMETGCLSDRRISLQLPSKDESGLESKRKSEVDKSLLLHSESVPILKVPELNVEEDPSYLSEGNSPQRKLSSPDDVDTEKGIDRDGDNNNGSMTVRPIYPYCPYSPYGSPQGSPRTRRRPLRESRRVSIDTRQGALQLNQYKLLDNIGQGSYGIVKLAYNEEDETHYAMKILSKKKLMKKAGIFGRMAPGRKGPASPLVKVYREIALLKKLDHPNVVKLVEILDDPDEDNLYLVFELVQKGEVLQIPTDKPLDEETARINFRDVVMGVEYLHYQRIVHRDIKPSNLLVDSEGRVKIADLGVSAELRADGELLTGSTGTPAFAAPETTTLGAQYSGTLCDVWSMGVTLYSLVTGKLPWDGSGSIIGVQAAVRSEPLKFPEKPELSETLKDLISHMLAKDPGERIQLRAIKEHPWLTNNGKEPLASEADNCRLPVTVTDEEVERVVTRVPKLDTLILIKTMLKQHSFQNPFLPRKDGKVAEPIPVGLPKIDAKDTKIESKADPKQIRKERFHRSGRSNSAPDTYDWHTNGRQISMDSTLAPVTEAEVEKR